MPNFNSLAGLEVAEKFVVVVVGWNMWLLWVLTITYHYGSPCIYEKMKILLVTVVQFLLYVIYVQVYDLIIRCKVMYTF